MSEAPANSAPKKQFLLAFALDWLFRILAGGVIACCVFTAAASFSLLAIAWNPFAIASGIFLLPWPFLVGLWQYQAVARFRSEAALRVAVILGVVTFIAAWMAVVGVQAWVALGQREAFNSLFLIGVSVALFAGVSALLNLRQRRRIEELSRPKESRDCCRLSLKELLLVASIAAVIVSLTIELIRREPPQFAEHVSRDRVPVDLPQNATDISYCQMPRSSPTAYEFTTDEASFREWISAGFGSIECRMSGAKLEPINNAYSISRLSKLTAHVPGPREITISDGLCFRWSHEDRGFYAAFDRATQRAYVYFHTH